MKKPTYDLVDMECRRASPTQRQYFEECKRVGSKSFLTHKHGCVLVKKGQIISKGFNFRLPETIAHNSNVPSIHAEISALNGIKKETVQDSDMYVVRVDPSCRQRVRYSKPCPHCSFIINKVGIRNVYYSINQLIEE